MDASTIDHAQADPVRPPTAETDDNVSTLSPNEAEVLSLVGIIATSLLGYVIASTFF